MDLLRLAFWFSGVCVTFAASVCFGGQRIESYFFPGAELRLESRWLVPKLRSSTDTAAASQTVAESPFTELRLVVPPAYVGKRVRIYFLLPSSAQGMAGDRGLDVEWRTQGVYLPGRARPGERVLFFEGPVSDNLLRDLVAYTIRIDANHQTGPVRFEAVYEIE